ncbi:MAG TPA: hypothetical protein VJ861_00775 [Treponemataceae bacterium]|nr:hypothetical protein [Treponemataceae bacterium]
MKHHTKEERLRFLNEWESSGKTAEDFSGEQGFSVVTLKRWAKESKTSNKQTHSFLPVKIVSEKNTDTENDPCLIKIGDIFTIECKAETSRRAIEIALQAVVKTCGQMLAR